MKNFGIIFVNCTVFRGSLIGMDPKVFKYYAKKVAQPNENGNLILSFEIQQEHFVTKECSSRLPNIYIWVVKTSSWPTRWMSLFSLFCKLFTIYNSYKIDFQQAFLWALSGLHDDVKKDFICIEKCLIPRKIWSMNWSKLIENDFKIPLTSGVTHHSIDILTHFCRK